MRPILFRGIPKRSMDFDFYRRAFPFPGNAYDGSFALGSLIVDKGSDRAYISCSAIVAMNCTVGNAQCCAIEVEPDSVGEYIGLIDKNEKLIFEGDIVKEDLDGAIAVIAFGDYASPFNSDQFTHNIGFYPKWEEKYRRHLRKDLGFYCIYGGVEVIGNVHDNPELWKEDQ